MPGSLDNPVTPRFGILGPLRVLADGRHAELGPRKQRIVLAILLCYANAPVSVSALTGALWGGAPPRTARKNIQVYVSALRRLVNEGADRIGYQCGAYIFRAEPWELDSLLFEERARGGPRGRESGGPRGRVTSQPAGIAEAFAGALDLWRGPVLAGLRDVPLIDAAARRLEPRYLDVFEGWAEAELAAGGAAAVAARITDVAREHPLRERLRTLQMTALRETGRLGEALAVYDELRQSLARELGLSPSPAAVSCYQTLLRSQPPAPGKEHRVLLPGEPPGFTGREQVTQRLTSALAGGNRVVVLTGSVGVGKTALAVHAARRLGGCFPGGRVFVRLRGEDGRPRSFGDVVPWLMEAITGRARTGFPHDAGRDWQLWLAGHRALIILDDARTEREVRPFLPETGDSAVLITARPRLAGLSSAYRLPVPAFGMDEALAYLGWVLGPTRVHAERPGAERIASAAGLLPLALRLVAERLALLRHLPLRDYADRMTSSSGLLDEVAAGDTAIRPLLAGVIASLPEDARRALPMLGRLPDPVFSISEAAAVLGMSEAAAAKVLETMLEASVITIPDVETMAHTVLYEIPPLAYAYAGEMAAASPAVTR